MNRWYIIGIIALLFFILLVLFGIMNGLDGGSFDFTDNDTEEGDYQEPPPEEPPEEEPPEEPPGDDYTTQDFCHEDCQDMYDFGIWVEDVCPLHFAEMRVHDIDLTCCCGNFYDFPFGKTMGSVGTDWCFDTDGNSRSPYALDGLCVDDYGMYFDSCLDGTSVNEYYCSPSATCESDAIDCGFVGYSMCLVDMCV